MKGNNQFSSIKNQFASHAIIFDMDGVLIDSEPIWKDAGIELFTRLGVPMTRERMAETMGMRCDEVVALRYASEPWNSMTVDEATDELIRLVVEKTKATGQALPGALSAIRVAQEMGVKTAIASSSPMVLIEAVIDHLQLGDFDALHSAFSEKRGKPAPDVYLAAAKALDILPEHCIVIEDSLNGMKAAKAAGMTCIAIPDARYFTHADIADYADHIFDSLEYCTREQFELFFA
ncbi:MAG TPA: hexitol phosphatase HxpB [Candidatus Magasanikbacteria bacterium]|uniref:Haloacid dehalogenase superfamily, subfamily IA, variant 3 n=1 Tax=Candidatus Magasanikbacteria bacterium GW2011_GWE2_42_7 TaxID=1619052 RepID=A0A0G1EA31_9BACT|nr:MAG: Haloacid dehalogenase superfamily, subfamily IA, variant 3 [Candidatus Magasanikbacteria bacterium GW2011_GWC2_42_27]KKS71453.1 MAG: Haloacid dehalogenase superfamily, subfamily IA, variant 3 [Candidatus Magasanikbacteria bacterium GW2011_GWE2_42_7]KKT24507.1 MAG: Haloacid dehalogenase superfamily, subfamily IA, variant 3 [Candidatus Magasanikbacteria bacterium GW2011_GWA2_43_9]HBB38270.1 hexitol phosphatase HxpB [Candidatus Magasanikbacteria bacterium]HCC13583.1 hexitol phosphatase Hxp